MVAFFHAFRQIRKKCSLIFSFLVACWKHSIPLNHFACFLCAIWQPNTIQEAIPALTCKLTLSAFWIVYNIYVFLWSLLLSQRINTHRIIIYLELACFSEVRNLFIFIGYIVMAGTATKTVHDIFQNMEYGPSSTSTATAQVKRSLG